MAGWLVCWLVGRFVRSLVGAPSPLSALTPRPRAAGNCPEDVRERDVDELFAKFGRIRAIDIKRPPRPPPFVFVEFEDRRDAEDAARSRDGYDFYGARLRVELAKGRGGRDRDGGGRGAPPGGARPSGAGHRVLVRNLPPSASWQDLKDFVRQAARPAFADVVKDRGDAYGVVEFESAADAEYAIRKLDDTEFRNPYDRAFVRLVEDRPGGGRGGGGGGGGGGGRGRSRSPRRRSRSPARRRSRSPRRERSASRSASPAPRARSGSPAGAGAGAGREAAAARSRSRSPLREGSAGRSASPEPETVAA
jgi:arginine/serine-rich splicing factor 1/9